MKTNTLKFTSHLIACLCLMLVLCKCAVAQEPPKEWIDPDTGHRVIRLSTEPNSSSLYFHQNAYTADGKKLIITTPGGISSIDLATRKIEQIVEGRAGVLVTGHKTGQIYYVRNRTVYAADPNTKETREVVKLPARGGVSSLNADETLLLGSTSQGGRDQEYVGPSTAPVPGSAPEQLPTPESSATPSASAAPGGASSAAASSTAAGAGSASSSNASQSPTSAPSSSGESSLTFAEQKEVRMNRRLEAKVPMTLFTVNTRTGEIKTLLESTDWLGHLQFSPTDPGLIMFCHEGPWHKVDRIWTIRTDGTGLSKIHTRTMNMEIAGHEFFSADGKTIWYDLQTPRGEDFWVASYELATGHRTWNHLQRDEWSVHFNVSPNGEMFAGDGGDNEMVAHAKNGKWIYLFRPHGIPDVAGIKAPNSDELIRPGAFDSERLVNMSKHDYRLEPNVTFSPDMKWVVFRSNMFGPTHVFAVEIAKAQ